MRWAKTEGLKGEFRLTNSGMPDLQAEDLHLTPDDLNLHPDNYDRPRDLTRKIARYHDVPEESVLITASASHATALALLSLLGPDDEALVETPTYPPLRLIPGLAGARVNPLPRRLEEQYAIDPDDVRQRMTARTRVIALTNLHNPTGVLLPPENIAACANVAKEHDATLVVDEVYLDFVPGAQSAFAKDRNVIAVSSVTKAFGLGGLRLGWMLGPPPLIQQAIRLNDLLVVHPPFPSTSIATTVFDRRPIFQRTIDEALAITRPMIDEFMRSRDDLEWVRPEHGIVAFPRIHNLTDCGAFLDQLLSERGVNLTPGRFFGDRAHFRIAFGRDPSCLEEALLRIGLALDSRK